MKALFCAAAVAVIVVSTGVAFADHGSSSRQVLLAERGNGGNAGQEPHYAQAGGSSGHVPQEYA